MTLPSFTTCADFSLFYAALHSTKLLPYNLSQRSEPKGEAELKTRRSSQSTDRGALIFSCKPMSRISVKQQLFELETLFIIQGYEEDMRSHDIDLKFDSLPSSVAHVSSFAFQRITKRW